MHTFEPVHKGNTAPKWLFVHVVDPHYGKAACEILAKASQYRCYTCDIVGDHVSADAHMSSRLVGTDHKTSTDHLTSRFACRHALPTTLPVLPVYPPPAVRVAPDPASLILC
jgi:hypothetical protein